MRNFSQDCDVCAYGEDNCDTIYEDDFLAFAREVLAKEKIKI